MELLKYDLDDLAEDFFYGSMPKEEDFCDEGYPVFSGYRIVGYSSKFNIKERTLVVVARGVGGTGDVAIAGEKTFLTNLAIAIPIKNNLANIDYLKYYLNIQGLRYLDSGAAQSQITINNLRHHKVFIPDIHVQNRIANVLATYDNLIEVNNKRIKVLEQMAENLYKEWFVRFRFPGHESAPFENGLPKGWKIKRVDAIGEVIGGGTPSTNVDSFWNGTIPWLTPADLSNTNRILIRRGSTNISSEGLKRSGATMMPPDTVLVSSRAPVGYLAIAANPICTNQGFKSIVCFEGKTSPYYLFFFLRSNREMLQNYATGATFPELSGNRMKKIKILVPDYQIQHRFETIAKGIICEMDKLEEANDLLKHQRDLLLPRLMSGKLEV